MAQPSVQMRIGILIVTSLFVFSHDALSATRTPEQAIADIRDDIIRIGKDRKKYPWSGPTDENIVTIKRIAMLASKDPEVIKKHVSDLLKPGVSGTPKACGEPGRIDVEIALELVQTAYLSNNQISDVRDLYQAHCSQKQSFLSNESCAELIKVSLLKGKPAAKVMEMAKSIYGFGLTPGIKPETVAELVKLSLISPYSSERLLRMFDEVYSVLSYWGPNSSNAIELVKAAALGRETDMKSLLLKYKELYGWHALASGYNASGVAEAIKIAAVVEQPANAIFHQVKTEAYGWGFGDGISKDTSGEIVKLANIENQKMRELLKYDHRIRGAEVDRADCGKPGAKTSTVK